MGQNHMSASVGRLLRSLFLVTLSGCPSPQPPPGNDGGAICDVQRPTTCTEATLRYADVKPTIDQHCVGCHNGAIPNGPWPLTTWQDVADWQDIVRDDIANCLMPPQDAGTIMSATERRLVLDWLRCGFPR